MKPNFVRILAKFIFLDSAEAPWDLLKERNGLTTIAPEPISFVFLPKVAVSASRQTPWDFLKERNGLTTIAPGPNFFRRSQGAFSGFAEVP